ncbi:winged helix-turn-helix domain-containing protein [Streptomyces sp. NPDC000594]|uniref:ArsR/SmtB family transcription factor n=1 Tax=Streptomyces sp. NPDC000594 TaxID=3154261 RepID=UPI00332F268A
MVQVGRAQGGTVEIEFTAEDMAGTRFAVSPLGEVVASVRALGNSGGDGGSRHWADRVRPLLTAARLDLTPLTRLVGQDCFPGFPAVPGAPDAPGVSGTPGTPGVSGAPGVSGFPDFPFPAPRTPRPSIAVELATLRAARPGPDSARLAELIAAYWEVALAPFWPRMLALFEGDILDRAVRLAEGGARRLFDDFGPQITWESGRLRLVRCAAAGTGVDGGGRGLLLVPSAFTGPGICSHPGGTGGQPTLRYPPRGIGTLWGGAPEPCSDALAGVLGRTRARLLAELVQPASTTDLARRIGVSAGGVSQHLTALRAAGLVSAHRTGRVVLYARTGVGEALVGTR